MSKYCVGIWVCHMLRTEDDFKELNMNLLSLFLNWMQSKLNGKQGIKKASTISANHHMLQEPRKEEFSDWPQGLLAIGTFGNNDLKEDPERHNLQGNSSSSQDHLQDLTPEEVVKLQKELKLLLHKQNEYSSTAESATHNLPLDKFLNCPSSLEVDRTNSDAFADDFEQQRWSSPKMFVCRSGFAPAPSLRDPLPESRMEKILRAILHKKIYPQTSSPTVSKRKCLENGHMPKSESEDEMNERANDGSKWVKTDSEYIVLEI
ncbi:hypothetical protein L1049_022132 [Liquidambar formosana]|uniref:Uncharacterized protein n=1 Tax=Liquidambar formosana TaxID=63359 RepID=A0AAP0RC37_LIQFO